VLDGAGLELRAGGIVGIVGENGSGKSTLMKLLVGALVGAVASLFLMQSTCEADGRLVITGFSPASVIAARLGVLLLVGVLVTAVTVGLATTMISPEALAAFALATVLGTVIDALLGALAGLVVGRLAGVYLVLFGTMIDLFLLQNPLATDTPAVAAWLPGSPPVELALEAMFVRDVTLEPLASGLGTILIVGVLATVAFALRR
jgi:energy-coupling factor transporter ATP-binding protein EcfA2